MNAELDNIKEYWFQ